ncbi:MAG TPA: S8 family serine peptidase [bacterium]|nr:S8 family serine peptidase [bacterium]HQG44053.1 S8 family serine peptidase [bacterium]HQI48792.1 S8 family serine peptidase [bacterium]HQJ63561.1 S8 family serine peptidase [bacterium]
MIGLKRFRPLLVLLMMAGLCTLRLQPAAALQTAATGKALPGVVALALKEPLSGAATLSRTGSKSLDAALQALQIQVLEPVAPALGRRLQKSIHRTRVDNLYYAFFPGGRPPQEVARELARDPAVEFAEARYEYQLTAVPNDPLTGKQYYLNKTRLPQAWDLCKGEQGSVVIAIIDGGTDISHPDLAGNLWTNPGEIPGNGRDDDGNGFIDDLHGWNFTTHTADPNSLFSGTTYSSHGTHTAGAACAVANNRIGIAGTSWNARLMALNAGSRTADDKIDPLSIDQAIIYATANGANILSCSFSGAYSEVNWRLIRFATEQGMVVVAAAGNSATLANEVYPASYPGVLAVAAIDSSDIKAYFSNYGTTVDVSAPGVGIWSTVAGGGYEGPLWQGTSMSTPIAAGVVALVMTQHPEWSGLQAAEQVRITADKIDSKNPAYAGQLGHGRINAWRALSESWPALRLTGIEFADQDGDSLIKPGETVALSLTLTNYLAAAQNISLKLSESSPYVTLSRSTATLAALSTGESITLRNAFTFEVARTAPSDHTILFTLNLSEGEYNDADHFSLTVLPSFADIGINNIYTTVTSIGRIGSANPNSSGTGIGLLYKSGSSLLFEGALIAGTAADRIVNAARGILDFNNSQVNDADFTSSEGGDVRIATPGALLDQESSAIFDDRTTARPLNIRITQQTFASREERYADNLLFRYTVHNLNAQPLENFHLGIFCDWDMDATSYATNVADLDAGRRMGFAYDAGTGPKTHVGVMLLSDGGFSYRAIMNDNADPLNPSWALHDGFTDAEKWQAISGGLVQTKVGPADISMVIGSGPHTIAANGDLTIDFAFLAADDLATLKADADSARALWRSLFTTGIGPTPGPLYPAQWTLEANYPNPFNAGTTIRYALPAAAPVRLELFDCSGRLVRLLVDATQTAGSHEIQWDGRDQEGRLAASGTYFYRLRSGGRESIRKLLLLR